MARKSEDRPMNAEERSRLEQLETAKEIALDGRIELTATDRMSFEFVGSDHRYGWELANLLMLRGIWHTNEHWGWLSEQTIEVVVPAPVLAQLREIVREKPMHLLLPELAAKLESLAA